MTLPKPLLNPSSFFAPALNLISIPSTKSTAPFHHRDLSLDDTPPHHKMGRLSRHISRDSSSSEHSTGIPLIDFSRTPSPSPYRARTSRSATQSEDEDEADIPLSLRPLVGAQAEPKRWWRSGGLGTFLFGSWTGWQVYVGFLVLYVTVVGYVLVLLNRFILWSKSFPTFFERD